MTEKSHPAEAGLTQAKQDNEQTVYEVGFHVVPTVAEDAVAGVVDALRAQLDKSGAEILKEEFPHKITLAYTVERPASGLSAQAGKREKYNEAYFGWIKFAVEKEHIAALEALLRGTKEILRHLLVETVREDAAPRRAIYTSDRLEGETIKKPVSAPETPVAVSEEELDKSIDALVS